MIINMYAFDKYVYCGPRVSVKLCSFEEEERQENDDQAKRGHSSIPDRGG